MQYMFMFYADEAEWLALSEDERNSAIERIGAWYGEQAQAGRIVTGRRLGSATRATSVRLGRTGRSSRPIVTDGPFVETKEAIGSFAVVDVADHAAAVELAASWPGGGAVEIRPFAE